MSAPREAVRRIGPGNVVLYVFIFIGIVVGFFYLQHKFHEAGVRACSRANAVRVESNARIPTQLQDAMNLADLTAKLQVTHSLAQGVFAAQDAQARANLPLVKKLFPTLDPKVLAKSMAQQHALYQRIILAYRDAAEVEGTIAVNERAVHFTPLPITDCAKVVP